MAGIAALSHQVASAVVAYRGAQPVTAAQFVADAGRLAQRLPACKHLVNLCVDRYRFSIGLVAALMREQVSLLPPNQTPDMLGKLRKMYPDLYALTDAPQATCVLHQVSSTDEPAVAASSARFDVPAFDADQLAAIAFTSGSTGAPSPHRKSWGALARGATAEAARFALLAGERAGLVGTVPAQHMYGLESTVLLALRGAMALHAGRPFYPADVAAALAQIPGERVLVTTPVHLRALLDEGVTLPGLRLIVCATAPLSAHMAAQAEARFAAPLHEVYGFTEAGMVATRRTVEGPAWQCLDNVQLRREGTAYTVAGGHVEIDAAFSDVIEPAGEGRFILHGRDADLVNIAGKRTSLAHLNHQLNDIAAVRDGVFFMPDENPDRVTRLMAFVVAPGATREAVLHALRERVDPVFLPRPLYLVQSLPRNATGKLPRESLLQLARACATKQQRGDAA